MFNTGCNAALMLRIVTFKSNYGNQWLRLRQWFVRSRRDHQYHSTSPIHSACHRGIDARSHGWSWPRHDRNSHYYHRQPTKLSIRGPCPRSGIIALRVIGPWNARDAREKSFAFISMDKIISAYWTGVQVWNAITGAITRIFRANTIAIITPSTCEYSVCAKSSWRCDINCTFERSVKS